MDYDIHAEVHKKIEFKNKKNQDVVAYRVKVLILNPDIGMYINGNMVYAPNKENSDWSVQTPKVFNSKAKIVEFDGKSPLWRAYYRACLEAAQAYGLSENKDNDEDMSKYEGLAEAEFNELMMKDMEKLGY
jgi:hypothetical protein